MKQFGFFLLTLLIFSCSLPSDESDRDYIEILAVESALLPDEFVLGETYEISVNYILPTSCHAFNDIYFTAEQNERTVAIVSYVFTDGPCENETNEVDATFDFEATETGSYIFKFWQGETANGEDEYLIVEVPVIE